MATIDEVTQEIEELFTTFWASRTPIAYQDVEFNPDGTEFTALQINLSTGRQESIGAPANNLFRLEGIVIITINAEKGKGRNKVGGDELAEAAHTFLATFIGSLGTRLINERVIHGPPGGVQFTGATQNYRQINVIADIIFDQVK